MLHKSEKELYDQKCQRPVTSVSGTLYVYQFIDSLNDKSYKKIKIIEDNRNVKLLLVTLIS